jgi:hypothetical protein
MNLITTTDAIKLMEMSIKNRGPSVHQSTHVQHSMSSNLIPSNI